MAGKAAAKRLPSATLCLLGSGSMEWSKDKQIDVSQGMLQCYCSPKLKSCFQKVAMAASALPIVGVSETVVYKA